jgi:hypothetical protein
MTTADGGELRVRLDAGCWMQGKRTAQVAKGAQHDDWLTAEG